MPLAAILFDLDGTLHDKSATLRRVGQRKHDDAGLAAHGVPLDAWLQAYLGLNHQRLEKTAVFAELASRFRLPDGLGPRLLDDFDARLGSMAVPFPGALELVAWCRGRGLKVGIVTNGRDAFQRSKITGMGLDGAIDSTVTSGGHGMKKPDPALFRACLQPLGVQPAQAAFVGDDFQADMEPAIALGLLPVWKSERQSDRVAFSSPALAEIQAYLGGVA